MDEELLQDIVQKVDICDYIGNYVNLKPKGDELFGLCPFHSEDTPSFSVTPSNKKFYCFGCGCGGNVISFVSKHDGISYDTAALKLAGIYHIDGAKKIKSPTVSILRQYAALQSKSFQFQHEVLNDSVLKKYANVIIRSWVEEGIPESVMKRYGVRLDVDSNRAVYPVYNNDGQLINIKGRTLRADYKVMKIPKYINYYKVGEMDYLQSYSLNRYHIDSAGEIIIFEGVKSCMKAEAYGYYNTVS